jgi:uncharacterized protein YqjF (DUF2071 family)
MFAFLKDHPFAVEAYFESSLVLTFAVPKKELENLIPECLELDLFQDKFAFIAVAMVQTKYLRPKGLPQFLGNDFFLIGYRIFVRFTNNRRKSLRGLYILKSETDKKKMELLGNVFTHYAYSTTDITQLINSDTTEISSQKSDFKVIISNDLDAEIPLPESSPFPTWQAARKFAGPLPNTFTFKKETREVLIIEGVRQNWIPQPVKVIDYKISFLDSLKLDDLVLANAFILKDIPYQWKKGRIEKWKK